MARHVFGPLLVLLVAGCGAPTLTAAGQQVRLMKGEIPKECSEIGTLEGFWSGDGYEDSANGAKTKLRNEAAARGANIVRLDTTNPEGTRFTGAAFKCPDDAVPEATR